jgi:hypothetical protein
MSAHSDILGHLTAEQLQYGARILQELIRRADEENCTEDATVYTESRNAMKEELDMRTFQKEKVPTYIMTVSSHHAVQILSVYYPEKTLEELIQDCEYDIRTMWNERGRRAWYCPASEDKAHWKPDKPVEMRMHSSQWPKIRSAAPLAIIHREDQSAFFTNAAPPVNVWWKAEDRIAEAVVGTWELVWREWRGDIIHEGWIQRVSEGTEGDFMHYLTRYKGGDPSPLPLQ